MKRVVAVLVVAGSLAGAGAAHADSAIVSNYGICVSSGVVDPTVDDVGPFTTNEQHSIAAGTLAATASNGNSRFVSSAGCGH